MSKEQYMMRPFFHWKNLIAQDPDFSLEMALQSTEEMSGQNEQGENHPFLPITVCLSRDLKQLFLIGRGGRIFFRFRTQDSWSSGLLQKNANF